MPGALAGDNRNYLQGVINNFAGSILDNQLASLNLSTVSADGVKDISSMVSIGTRIFVSSTPALLGSGSMNDKLLRYAVAASQTAMQVGADAFVDANSRNQAKNLEFNNVILKLQIQINLKALQMQPKTLPCEIFH